VTTASAAEGSRKRDLNQIADKVSAAAKTMDDIFGEVSGS
jgi:hypothetical protein